MVKMPIDNIVYIFRFYITFTVKKAFMSCLACVVQPMMIYV